MRVIAGKTERQGIFLRGRERLEADMLRAGDKHLAAGVGAAGPVDAHRLGGVQLLLQLLHNVHGPVLGLNHRKPAELQQRTAKSRDCCSSATVMVMHTSACSRNVKPHTEGDRLDTRELALHLPEDSDLSICWSYVFEYQETHHSLRQLAPLGAGEKTPLIP